VKAIQAEFLGTAEMKTIEFFLFIMQAEIISGNRNDCLGLIVKERNWKGLARKAVNTHEQNGCELNKIFENSWVRFCPFCDSSICRERKYSAKEKETEACDISDSKSFENASR
jgi:hypothetical protein